MVTIGDACFVSGAPAVLHSGADCTGRQAQRTGSGGLAMEDLPVKRPPSLKQQGCPNASVLPKEATTTFQYNHFLPEHTEPRRGGSNRTAKEQNNTINTPWTILPPIALFPSITIRSAKLNRF